jgi:hypothetical protein
MANSSFEGEFDEFLNRFPVELRSEFVRWLLEQRASLRRLDQKYFARITETERSADCLALILEHALARFDFLAHMLLILGSRYPNTNAIEADPLLQKQLEDLVKSTLKNVKPSLDKFGEDRAADVRSELNLKLRAKQQGCLASAELLQANGGALPNLDTFSRQIATSPMRSRADWWARPNSVDLDELLKAGDAALERGKAALESVEGYDLVGLLNCVERGSRSSESRVAPEEKVPEPAAVSEEPNSENRGSQFPVRSSWLDERLRERGWGSSDPYKFGGPDRKTVEKLLRGERVRNDILEKLATALSQRGVEVKVLDIPNE